MVTVRILRSDSFDQGGPRWDEFQIRVPQAEGWSVMDVLDRIFEESDGTLGYFRHSACRRGVCAGCRAAVDGKPRLLCRHPVPENGRIELAPAPGKSVTRDLVRRCGRRSARKNCLEPKGRIWQHRFEKHSRG